MSPQLALSLVGEDGLIFNRWYSAKLHQCGGHDAKSHGHMKGIHRRSMSRNRPIR